jgi:hypothetical protein
VISLDIDDVESSPEVLKYSVTITLDCRRRKTTSFSPPFLSYVKIFSRYNPMYTKGGVIMKRSITVTLIVVVIPWILFGQENWIEHSVDDSFDGASCVCAADIDDDGDIDILGGAFNYVKWWENDGNENFTEYTIAINPSSPFRSVYPIDLNGNNHLSILGAANLVNTIFLWENDGSETFTEHIIADNFAGAWQVYPIDLDEDDDIDVLGAAKDDDAITWWEYDGNDFTEHVIDSTFDGAHSVYAVDLDTDDDIDVLGAANMADAIYWWENDGNENFTKHVISDSFDGAWYVYACDLNGDDNIDILGAAAAADAVYWWENDGGENFTEHVIDSTFDGAHSVYAEDIDHDGDVDVLGAATVADVICWWENDGNENFTKHVISDSFDGAFSAYLIDLDSDNDIDVLGAAFYDDAITWWENVFGDVYDVGMVSINMPLIVPQDTTLNPQATVENMGTLSESFWVICEIEPGGYFHYQEVSDLAPGDSTQTIFDDPFTFASGSYTVTIYTQLEVDENPTNDTLEKVIETYNPGIAEGSLDIPQVLTFSAPTITKKRSEINLALPQATKVNLIVYDVLGRFTETIASKRFSAGTHKIGINLDLPAGIYFYSLKTASGDAVIKKFLLIE